MKYNQQAVDDLLSPLRYVNLKSINPNSINRIGEGVFPELTTLDHLSILDLVTKAYQAVHMPTLGHPIPQSTVLTAVTLGGLTTSADLITAASNEVIEVLGLNVKTVQSYEVGADCWLGIATNGSDAQPIMDLSRLEHMASNGCGLIYGTTMYDTGAGGAVAQTITPRKLLVNGGDTLSLNLDATPADDMIIQIAYRKVVQ